MSEQQRRRIDTLEQDTRPPDNPPPDSIVFVGVERNEDGELVEVCRTGEIPIGKPTAKA